MIIRVLERIFKDEMSGYWMQARNTGAKYAVQSIKAMIHSEIKVLTTGGKDHDTKQRVAELDFILSLIKRHES